MNYSTQFNSKTLMREFINQVQIHNPKERTTLKQKFQKKLSHHINMIQYHRLREDRFILSQKKILEKQNNSIERAKQFLNLKQQKASSLKNYNLVQRSKRAQEDLNRWETIVQKNKDNYEKRINQSQIVIKNWHNKLSQSSQRKSMILDDLSKNLKEKLTQKQRKILNIRSCFDYSNPESPLKQLKVKKKKRKQDSIIMKQRLPTQTIIEKRRKQQQQQMNQSIIKIVNKQQRINQARYTRHFLHQKKKNQLIEKGKMMQVIRDHHLNSLRTTQQEKHQQYDRQYKIQRVKSNHLISKSKQKINVLKDISKSNSKEKIIKRKDASSMRIFNSFGQQLNQKRIQYSQQTSPNRNYQKLMTEKLKDISMIMRLNRNIRKIQ